MQMTTVISQLTHFVMIPFADFNNRNHRGTKSFCVVFACSWHQHSNLIHTTALYSTKDVCTELVHGTFSLSIQLIENQWTNHTRFELFAVGLGSNTSAIWILCIFSSSRNCILMFLIVSGKFDGTYWWVGVYDMTKILIVDVSSFK